MLRIPLTRTLEEGHIVHLLLITGSGDFSLLVVLFEPGVGDHIGRGPKAQLRIQFVGVIGPPPSRHHNGPYPMLRR